MGVYQGQVTIFNGFPQSVGPLHLSDAIEVSTVTVDDLQPFVANQVYSTIRVDSIEAARTQIALFETEITSRQSSTSQPTVPTPDGQ